jgi:hypothetical protein
VVEWQIVNTRPSRSTYPPARQQADRPIGIIQSLASGFDLVTRYPVLMLLPVLLDVFLWLGPRLSAYPLFRSYLDFLQSPDMQAILAPNSPQQLEQMQKLLDQTGQMFNLFWWLSPTLLGVPGLMVGVPANQIPSGAPATWQVSNVLVYLALFIGLSLAGLALSAVYWAMLASRVRGERVDLLRIASLWWGLCKVTLLLIVAALVVGLPTFLAALVVALFNVVVAQIVLMLGASLLLWLGFYLAFILHGIALRDWKVFQSARASIFLMRTQFPPTMGLVILAVGIYFGMGYVWNIPTSDSWLRAAGILGNAFTATGVLAATALYYQSRTQSQVTSNTSQAQDATRST